MCKDRCESTLISARAIHLLDCPGISSVTFLPNSYRGTCLCCMCRRKHLVQRQWLWWWETLPRLPASAVMTVLQKFEVKSRPMPLFKMFLTICAYQFNVLQPCQGYSVSWKLETLTLVSLSCAMKIAVVYASVAVVYRFHNGQLCKQWFQVFYKWFFIIYVSIQLLFIKGSFKERDLWHIPTWMSLLSLGFEMWNMRMCGVSWKLDPVM